MVTVKHLHIIRERLGRYESNQYETCYFIAKTQERYLRAAIFYKYI
jgi:hypothetical protein